MISEALPLLRHVARALRYRELTSLIGRPIELRNAQSASDILRGIVLEEGLLDADMRSTRKPDNLAATVAKYGLLDLEYTLPQREVAALPRLSHRELRELGFQGDLKSAREPNDAMACLDSLCGDLEDGGAYLKLFLRDMKKIPAQTRLKYRLRGMPRGYWPCRFTIVDACLTNAPSIWLSKHFYL